MLWTDIWGVCQEPNQLVGVGWEAQYGVESWVGWGSRVRQKEGKEGGGRGDDTREWGRGRRSVLDSCCQAQSHG